ncbi:MULTISPECIES: hypothetical protein [unclassified Rhodococcus (in: high G+C Gram-positive bacteria)]|uniref:hypothetical protein n=1 Tax=unclassified Rhodococcus (in: high G+C Gram-positive bacteria) TaxID=192944 RepID=UPI00163B46D7|nr:MULTISPECIES: hypothetical protein [unclassified Rhodococcus (in: high G+C Gram-positive bacteria)]MBC2641910.1 hypothetical protein [Rhodococcus sp. 3A]MBC2893348.1 hypothetical protein [Rhodococcus sp. 4CII]
MKRWRRPPSPYLNTCAGVIALADMDAVRTFDTLAHAFTAAHTATSSAYKEPPPRQTG